MLIGGKRNNVNNITLQTKIIEKQNNDVPLLAGKMKGKWRGAQVNWNQLIMSIMDNWRNKNGNII